MLIDPRHLEQLSVIVDIGTLQGAAAEIGTSQPALSRMLSNLESRIGQPLFERKSRPLQPTALGHELADQGRAIRNARQRALEYVDYGARGYFGVLKVGAPPFLCGRLVSQAIASFIAQRQKARIDLVADYYPALEKQLYQNKIDVIIGPDRFIADANTHLNVVPLFSDANVLVGRAGHPLLSQDKLTSEDLQQAVWVAHTERSALRGDMETALRRLGIENPAIAFQSAAASAVLELLRNTDFLTVLPRYVVPKDGNDGLQTHAIADFEVEHSVAVITLKDRPENPLLASFKEHVKNVIGFQART